MQSKTCTVPFHQQSCVEHICDSFSFVWSLNINKILMLVDSARPTFNRLTTKLTILRKHYRRLLGCLLCLHFTRPDLLNALQLLSHHAHDAPVRALWALVHWLGDILGSKDHEYVFHAFQDLHLFHLLLSLRKFWLFYLPLRLIIVLNWLKLLKLFPGWILLRQPLMFWWV